jgi:hypothetical protein
MEERTFIPGSPACGQWETLLTDALDGLLSAEDEATFIAHRSACPACAVLYEEARKGREWLEFLAPEPETPAGLFDKILARTGPGQEADYGLVAGGGNLLPMPPAWQRPGFRGRLRRFAEPRLMMTAAMAFFSIAMTLSLTGVRLSSARISDLRPGTVAALPGTARSFLERQLSMASTPIIRYYDHLRLVYEVQTTMRELRRTARNAGQGTGEGNRQNQQKTTPGESRRAPGRTPGHKDGGSRVQPLPQSIGPANGPEFDDSDFLETSLTLQDRSSSPAAKTPRRGPGPAHSGGAPMEMRKRSTEWTA